MADKPLIVKCPVCAAAVKWVAEQPFRPFCSERCKMIDFGDWATEAHSIPGSPVFEESDGDDNSF